MSRYYSRQELANKIDYEGGIFDMLFGYGLSRDDMPEGDAELLAAMDRIQDLREPFEAAIDAFRDLLPEPAEEDDYE